MLILLLSLIYPFATFYVFVDYWLLWCVFLGVILLIYYIFSSLCFIISLCFCGCDFAFSTSFFVVLWGCVCHVLFFCIWCWFFCVIVGGFYLCCCFYFCNWCILCLWLFYCLYFFCLSYSIFHWFWCVLKGMLPLCLMFLRLFLLLNFSMISLCFDEHLSLCLMINLIFSVL